MADTDATAVTQRVERTLNAASHTVSQNKEWADRVRGNWIASERSEGQRTSRDRALEAKK